MFQYLILYILVRTSESKFYFNSCQHGFSETLSYETQLLRLTNYLHFILDREFHAHAEYIFLDFSEPCDKVPHNLRMSKLARFDITSSVLNWMTSFLANLSQFVFCDDTESCSVPVQSFVLQSFVLGPLLFFIYNSYSACNISSSTKAFSDDCVMFCEITKYSDIDILQSDFISICNCCDRRQMANGK